jgi:hypothetical protein
LVYHCIWYLHPGFGAGAWIELNGFSCNWWSSQGSAEPSTYRSILAVLEPIGDSVNAGMTVLIADAGKHAIVVSIPSISASIDFKQVRSVVFKGN